MFGRILNMCRYTSIMKVAKTAIEDGHHESAAANLAALAERATDSGPAC